MANKPQTGGILHTPQAEKLLKDRAALEQLLRSPDTQALMAMLERQAGVLGGGDGPKRVLSLAVIWAVCALEAAPGLLSAATMVWGAELARALGREDFDREGVELCGRTAQACRILAQATVALAVSANLLQLLLLPLLHAVRPALSLPLVSLALSAGLMLLCRCLRRGQALQEDRDSII